MTSNDERLIASARAGADEDVESIIRICRLKPSRPHEWKVWVDEGANRLRIRTDRQVRIYLANEPIAATTTEDLYFKAQPRQIAKYSRWGLILRGRDAKSLAFLLGADNRLRLVYFRQGKWAGNRYPLEAGIHVLRVVAASCGYRARKNRKKHENRICDLPDIIARFDFQLTDTLVLSAPGRDIIEGIANCQRVTTR